MAGAQGPAALAHGTQQQLLAAEDRWSGRHHAFSFASPVPSSSLAALQRPAQEGTPHGAAASGGGSCGAPPPQQAMQARSNSTSPTALVLAATLESAAKQRVRAAAGWLAGWRLLARLALHPWMLCTAPLHIFSRRSIHFAAWLPQGLAESALHSLHAASGKAAPHPSSAAGKENAASAALPWLPGPPDTTYGHQRVSPGHFLVQPTRSPLQQQQYQQQQQQHLELQQWEAGSPATTAGVAPAASTSSQRGGSAAAADSGTPLSQQGSRVSSALVDHLNLALRALGGRAWDIRW